ncbi:MAG: YihY/virulence factor BrkB family protein, partial [Verrucomicrobia bacterium]|nr:YihY/virulence factor BrkB family protein [Verrucomicrobiota bacterium]
MTAKSSALPATGEAAASATDTATARDIWRARLKRVERFWKHVWRAFVQNRCPARAAALAYGSLLALVPMLAVVASVSAALLKRQGEEPVERFVESLVTYVAPAVSADTRPAGSPVTREDVQLAATRKEMARRINEFISNIRSGAIGVAGSVALVIVAIMMLARVEDTLNDIWGVTRGRHWLVRIGNY